ncbi:ferritin-like domain-containing protein [Plectonema radiosum NIES-515]|uniref:Ferritin-like domain-containing protein n=1 Tax=Plectonema radiosum NIES-515 TaxID=2986073 RepID=A0ABT3AS39_9CYAN|nr:ferritin-like domain-containing protein [Plectonema radiosum]MCV3211947.1 ferritin-like domain-containing protein [Plectonema radiosum NIES-515]
MDDRALTKKSSRRNIFSRRDIIISGGVIGVASALGLPLIAEKADAQPAKNMRDDVKILNNALYYEHQAIWAYSFAAGKLTNTDVGKAVLALALRNQADHKKHRDALAAAISSMGGTPVKAESKYDVSSYIKKGEGNVDSDVNIAKLALALETDAAIAYTQEIAKLKTPKLITVGASIGATESAHAAAIRATFKALGVDLEIVPASFVSMETRDAWVLKV